MQQILQGVNALQTRLKSEFGHGPYIAHPKPNSEIADFHQDQT